MRRRRPGGRQSLDTALVSRIDWFVGHVRGRDPFARADADVQPAILDVGLDLLDVLIAVLRPSIRVLELRPKYSITVVGEAGRRGVILSSVARVRPGFRTPRV